MSHRLGTPKPWALRLFAGSWGGLLSLAVLLWHESLPVVVSLALLAAAAGLWLVGGVAPAALAPAYRLTERVLHPLGRLVSLLMFALVYFGIFTPVAWCLRMVGKDLLLLNHHQRSSGWVERSGQVLPDHDYRQY